MNLKIIMLSEESQTKKPTYHMIPCIWDALNILTNLHKKLMKNCMVTNIIKKKSAFLSQILWRTENNYKQKSKWYLVAYEYN